MVKFKKFGAALALCASVLPVAAMQPLSELEMAQSRAREGFTVLADLKLQAGSMAGFTPFAQAFFRLNDLLISGLLGARVDVLTDSMYATSLSDSLKSYGIKDADVPGFVTALGPAMGFKPGADVVQISFPAWSAVTQGTYVSLQLSSVNTGSSGPSLGGMVFQDLNPTGTRIWVSGRSH